MFYKKTIYKSMIVTYPQIKNILLNTGMSNIISMQNKTFLPRKSSSYICHCDHFGIILGKLPHQFALTRLQCNAQMVW